MPKYNITDPSAPRLGPYTIFARNATTGGAEIINISSATQNKFKDVGKRPIPKRPRHPTHRYRFDPELRAEADAQYEIDTLRLRLLNEDMRKQSLAERIGEPHISLEQRLEHFPAVVEELGVEPEKVLPKFKKTKIMNRQREYGDMIDSVARKLGRLHDILTQKMSQEAAHPTQMMSKYLDVAQVITAFNKLNTSWEEYQGKLTNKQWRVLKADLKGFKDIRVYELADRWEEIIGKIAGMKGKVFVM